MKIEELIKDLDPVTIIEFKNYVAENLGKLCKIKNSNSKIISNWTYVKFLDTSPGVSIRHLQEYLDWFVFIFTMKRKFSLNKVKTE